MHRCCTLWNHGQAYRYECCWFVMRACCVFILALGCSCFCRSFVCFPLYFVFDCSYMYLWFLSHLKLWMVKKLPFLFLIFNAFGRCFFVCLIFYLVTCKQYYLRRDPITSLFPLRAIFLPSGNIKYLLNGLFSHAALSCCSIYTWRYKISINQNSSVFFIECFVSGIFSTALLTFHISEQIYFKKK